MTVQPCASFWASKLRMFHKRYLPVQEALSTVHRRQRQLTGLFLQWRLGRHNIILKNGRIVIIGWEGSGWFPEY